MKNKIFLFGLFFSMSCYSDSYLDGYHKVMKNNEEISNISSSDIKSLLKGKEKFLIRNSSHHQFGVTSIDSPFINVDKTKLSEIYYLLSLSGVDNVKSGAADWSRIDDGKSGFTKLNDLNIQLSLAKKYGLSTSFIIGYPPIGRGNYSKSIRTAVNNNNIDLFVKYLDFIVKYLKPYDVQYLEIGNEVDAGSHWWIHSTPTMYVNEIRLLNNAIKKNNSNIKVAAFSATYSRYSNLNKAHEGRDFILECLGLGINNYTDAYAIHHYTFPNDDGLVEFMRRTLSREGINKKIIDTEQMDITDTVSYTSKPYDIIKMLAIGTFKYNIKHIDYFMARDEFIERKVYPNGFTQGLFDLNWNPKPRLLAYAMAIDAMKGRELIKMSDNNNLNYYFSKDVNNISKYKYSLLLWGDSKKNITLSKDMEAEYWNLKVASNGDTVSISKPVVIFSHSLISLENLVK